MEVIFTVLKLFSKNPEQVFLIRGNHEDLHVNSYSGFLDEIARKTPPSDFRDLALAIINFYHHMPVVIYVGRDRDWIQVCHGGLEPGYDPGPLLLNKNKENKFHLIFPLKRNAFFSKFLVDEESKSFLNTTINSNPLDIKPLTAFPSNHVALFEKPSGNEILVNLGFMWADFIFESALPNNFTDGRGFSYGKGFAQKSLEFLGVAAVIRAHQHGDEAMMHHLKTQGLFCLWQEGKASAKTIPLARGAVFMFNVGADTPYWWNPTTPWGPSKIATFGELKVAKSFDNWTMTRHQVEVTIEPPQVS